MEKETNKTKNPVNKEQESNKNKTILFLSIAVVVVLILIVGITYAFFTTDLKADNETGIELARFELHYNEGEAINVTQSYSSESEALANVPYSEFSVEGYYQKSATINYDIYLEEDSTSTISKEFIKTNLVKVENGTETNVLTPTLIKNLEKYGSEENKRLLYTGSLSFTATNPNPTDTYRLRAWITEDGVNFGNQSLGEITIESQIYKFKINVSSANS